MSAVGRLWRRAPACRLWLFLALACTGLAAMFPPPLPTLSLLRPPGASAGAHFAPEPSLPPVNGAAFFMPAITATRQTLIPFAGRQLPLPAGKWTELALLRATGTPPEQGLVLARLQSGRTTGMIVVVGTSVANPNTPLPVAACLDPTGLPVHDLTPADGRDPALEECWSVRRLATSELADPDHHPLEAGALKRLGTLGVAVPTHAVAARYFRHDDQGLLVVTTMLPDPAESESLMRRVEAWTGRWVPLLHRGFDSRLSAAEVTPALARDPAMAAPAAK